MSTTPELVRASLLHTRPAEGPLPAWSPAELVADLDEAGLTGRGGAGFPTAVKLRAFAGGRRTVVVGNAMEGEPLSGKDAWLLATSPHLVVEGLALVASATGSRAVLAVGGHVATPVVDGARRAASRHGVEVRVVDGGFVAGQESALVNALSGGPAVPLDPAVRVLERGVRGRPTLVMNAETLAHVALVARVGPAAWRAAGTAGEAGPSLFTVSGAVARPGVVEAPRGSRVTDVVAAAGPGAVRAVLVGGYHGAWLPASALGTRLARADLAPWGAAVGAGVLHVLGVGACPLRATADVAAYLAGESAGQCGPCVNALPRVADTLARLAVPRRGEDPRLPAEVERLAALATGRGACAHPDGTVRMVLSALRVFEADVAAHLAGACVATTRGSIR